MHVDFGTFFFFSFFFGLLTFYVWERKPVPWCNRRGKRNTDTGLKGM